MIAKRGMVSALVVMSLFLVLGCGREKPKSAFELGKEHFEASNYPQAMIRLENWIQENPDSPQNIQAHAMLAVMYHDDETRQDLYKTKLEKLKTMGESGMAAVLKLTENKKIADRLTNTINDILIQGGSLSVGPLMEDMQSQNWRLKRNAQQVLIQIGEPALDSLIKFLDNPDPYNRAMAAEAIGQIGDKKGITPLEQKLDDPSKVVQITVATALLRMGQSRHKDVIINALSDENVQARRVASEAIWELINTPPVNTLLKALKDTDPEVRRYAALALGKTKSPDAIQPLLKVLQEDEDDQNKNAAAGSLVKIGRPAVKPLIEALGKSNDIDVTIRIVQTLGNIGDKRAIKPMEKVYNEATIPLLKNETAKALNKID
jgi:HEAT repeat protein